MLGFDDDAILVETVLSEHVVGYSECNMIPDIAMRVGLVVKHGEIIEKHLHKEWYGLKILMMMLWNVVRALLMPNIS